jgi:hypothetical protein
VKAPRVFDFASLNTLEHWANLYLSSFTIDIFGQDVPRATGA